MPTHTISAKLPTVPIGNADVEFKIMKDRAVIGTLLVSKGAVVWTPRDHTNGYKMSWTDFDGLMRSNGKKL